MSGRKILLRPGWTAHAHGFTFYDDEEGGRAHVSRGKNPSTKLIVWKVERWTPLEGEDDTPEELLPDYRVDYDESLQEAFLLGENPND